MLENRVKIDHQNWNSWHRFSKANGAKPFWDSTNLENARRYAFDITSSFEGGKLDSLQIIDSGIISYGKHQATLASGALERVLNEYIRRSNDPITSLLRGYLDRVQNKDKSLRYDKNFLTLLKDAAKDRLMAESQDIVFARDYWEPTLKIAKELSITSPIGLAILYDTKVQGGLLQVINRTERRLQQRLVSEGHYLKAFLEERRGYLLDVAQNKINAGDNYTGLLLKNSAQKRIATLLKYLKDQLFQ